MPTSKPEIETSSDKPVALPAGDDGVSAELRQRAQSASSGKSSPMLPQDTAPAFTVSPSTPAELEAFEAQRRADGQRCLEAALDYRRRGWSVLPLCPADHVGVGREHSRTCSSPGKAPLIRWAEFQTRLAAEDEIRSWWRWQPAANVGVVLGRISQLVRVDVDGPAGEEALAKVSQGQVPLTLEFRTGRADGSGRGLLFCIPPDLELATSSEGLGVRQELRFQAEGSQTGLPPNRHPSGGLYAWLPGHGPGEVEPALAPPWLLEELTPRPGKARKARSRAAVPIASPAPPPLPPPPAPAGDGWTELPMPPSEEAGEPGNGAAAAPAPAGEAIPEGSRHSTLLSLAGVMRRHGATETEILAALSTANRDRCQPPLPDREVEELARDVAQRYEPEGPSPTVRPSPGSPTETTPPPPPAADPQPSVWPPLKAPRELQRCDRQAEWICEGLLARNAISLLSALWKVGKTTLLALLLKALAGPGWFCGQAIARGAKVLYVTEEHEGRWAERCDKIGIGDHVRFLIRPFASKPTVAGWQAFLTHLASLLPDWPADLIVLDTLSNLWPVKDENSNAEVQAALMPLHQLTTARAVLLVHHLRKGDGSEATGSRGAGALTAFVDTIIELRRYQPGDRKDRRRVLTGYGRYEETIDEIVIQLSGDRTSYAALGDKDQTASRDEAAALRALQAVIQSLLPNKPPGLTRDELLEQWPAAQRPAKQRLLEALNQGVPGLWNRDGEGVKGSPHRYWIGPRGPAADPGTNGEAAGRLKLIPVTEGGKVVWAYPAMAEMGPP